MPYSRDHTKNISVQPVRVDAAVATEMDVALAVVKDRELIQDKNRLYDEFFEERRKNELLSSANADLRVANEQLKSKISSAWFADILITVGVIGLGILSILEQNNSRTAVENFDIDWYSIFLVGTLVTVFIGLLLKIAGWFSRR